MSEKSSAVDAVTEDGPRSTSTQSAGPAEDMIVVQFGRSMLKGYTRRAAWTPAALDKDGQSPPIFSLGAAQSQAIDLNQAKAAFFVRSFEGKGLSPIHFHGEQPHKEALWVRVVFNDGEVVEGMLTNSKDLLLHSNLFIVPYDPEGNNLLMIVAKAQIAEFHVLGLRTLKR